MERTIRVEGTAAIRVQPDAAEIEITLEGVCPTAEAASAALRERTAVLHTALSAEGFDADALKTRHIGVSERHESREENGVWRDVVTGFDYQHTLAITLPRETGQADRLLAALAACPAAPTYTVRFAVLEPRKARDLLLQKAFAEGKHRAEVLADAAGVRLGKLAAIRTGWQDGAAPLCGGALRMAKAADTAINLIPEEIELSDSVCLEWELE